MRHRRTLAGGQPGVAPVLRVDPVDAGQGDQQHADAETDGQSGDDQPGERLAATPHGEPEAEPDHVAAGSALSALTRPSRTTTWRSAYAATRGSWVTSTTVVPDS